MLNTSLFKGVNLSDGFNLGNVAKAQFGNIMNPEVDLFTNLDNPFNGTNSTGQVKSNTGTNTARPSVNTPPAPPAPKDPYNEADAQAAADAAEREMTLFQIDNGISGAQGGLSRLGNQREIGVGNIQREWQAAADMLLGKRKLGQQQFDQNKTNQLNEYSSARNVAADGARSWLSGARGTLGAQGAGSGSKARYVLPFEAQTMAAKGNQTAQNTNNKNITSMTQAWDKDQQEIGNEERRVGSQRDQGIRDLDSKIESSRVQLMNTIAMLTGQKNILGGGNAKTALAAANPMLSQIPGMLNNIDNLSATVPIAAQDISLSRPDLSGYNFAQPEAAPMPQQDPTLAGNPVMAALFGQQQDEQNQPRIFVPNMDEQQYMYA